MAYALGFPKDVTDCIYGMRDFRLEMVRNGGKTPSRQCFEIGHPWHCLRQEKPTLFPMAIPYYSVESDSDDSDYGEIMLDIWNRGGAWANRPWGRAREICIERYNTAGYRHKFVIQEEGGRAPAKVRRLKKQSDRRIQEMWFQCEPCES
jgi:hypothetical protein